MGNLALRFQLSGDENYGHCRGKDWNKFDKRRDNTHNLANFREIVRDIMTLYHSSEAINGEEFVLYMMYFLKKNLSSPYKITSVSPLTIWILMSTKQNSDSVNMT